MSQAVPGVQGSVEAGKIHRCRIPQRMVPGRLRNVLKPKVNNNNLENGKSKFEVISAQQSKNVPRPRSEDITRAKSVVRAKDQKPTPQRAQWTLHPPAHPAQLARETHQDRPMPSLKRPPAFLRSNENYSSMYKPVRPIIMIPQNLEKRELSPNKSPGSGFHDQVTVPYEEHEIHQSNDSNNMNNWDTTNNMNNWETNDEDSDESREDKIMRLKIHWQEHIVKFENMRKQLNEQQRDLLESYAKLRLIHQDMLAVDQTVSLPPSEDLRIMNVAKLTPDQLLQLCSEVRTPGLDAEYNGKTPLPMDLNMLYEMPSSIIATCDESLKSRKEIVDWFKEIIAAKAITKTILVQKVNQFKAENDLLQRTLDGHKEDFMRNINETVDFLKKSVNEAVAHQLHSEDLTCKLSEMKSVNEDLKRQLRATENRVSHKAKIEELEKELKDEKCKKMVIKDRLTRAEHLVRTNEEKAAQLEVAWEQAHSKTLQLERTVQQLRDEHQTLQSNFDEQIKRFTETIEENTRNLGEIETDRQKLQSEKEDLEKRLTELSEHYKEALSNAKHETSLHVAKLIDTEKKCNEMLDEKSKLESKTESLCAQLIESELRCKDMSKKLLEAEQHLSDMAECRRELETLRHQLVDANMELSKYKNMVSKQTEAVSELERSFQKVVESEGILKSDLSIKGEYISELEKQRSLLEQQLREGESKIESYAEQLSSLKNHLSQLQDFGDFENLGEMHKMINQQRMQLQEATEQNRFLAEALKKKDIEIERHIETLTEQRQLLEQRETVIKMLSDKDEEQSNIIKLLRNNLEIRAQADVDLNQQLTEKNAEVESLISNVETRKEQISQLEKIILTLEEQNRKANDKKRKDRETILLLEKKVAEYETYYTTSVRIPEAPTDNLDNLIKLLEHELGSPFQDRLNNKRQDNVMQRKNYSEQYDERDKLEKFECQEDDGSSRYKSQRGNIPTKIVMGNFVKKTYIPNDGQHKGDHKGDLDRKKAITSIETPKWLAPHESGSNLYTKTPCSKGNAAKDLTKNMPYFLMPNHIIDEKKCKMFKLAGHKVRS